MGHMRMSVIDNVTTTYEVRVGLVGNELQLVSKDSRITTDYRFQYVAVPKLNPPPAKTIAGADFCS